MPTTAELMRMSEQELLKRLNVQPNKAFTVGPQGAVLNVQINSQLPFRVLLESKHPVTGEPAMPDEVLYLLLRELEAEMKKRGLKP